MPYVLKRDMPRGGLLYFGATHSKDPKDPQLSRIEDLWQQFRPEIAFNEGGKANLCGGRVEPCGDAGARDRKALLGEMRSFALNSACNSADGQRDAWDFFDLNERQTRSLH